MLDGFNEGWIEFERGEVGSRKGKVALKIVLETLIERGYGFMDFAKVGTPITLVVGAVVLLAPIVYRF